MGHNDLTLILPFFEENFQEFILAFNALIHIEKNKKIYGFSDKPIIFNKNNTNSTLILQKPLFFDAVTDCVKFNFIAFKSSNPVIRKDIFPANYPLKLDSHSFEVLFTNLDSIYYYQDSILFNPKTNENQTTNGKAVITYTVRSGDYLGKVAELHHVKVDELQKWNNLTGTRINIGQQLIVYQPKPPINKSEYVIYKVEKETACGK